MELLTSYQDADLKHRERDELQEDNKTSTELKHRDPDELQENNVKSTVFLYFLPTFL